MFLFPLGLDAKTQRFPVATVLIFIGTVSYSIAHIDDYQHQASATLNAPATHELFRARSALAIAACAETDLAAGTCKFMTDNIPIDHPTNPLVTQARLSQAAGRAYGRLGPVKVADISPYLFEDRYWLARADKFQSHPEYQEFSNARKAYEREEANRQVKSHALSRSNISTSSVLIAQISHAGWIHLVGNMVFFLLLAIPVEERLGALTFSAIYLAGGSIGLLGHLIFTPDSTLAVVGASANISAIAGLFLALFQKSEMKIWVSAFFVWNKIAHMRAELFIPVFIVASDVVGSLGAGENVAHLAHLFGMATGVAAGVTWKKLRPLPEGVLFPFEHQLLIRAQNAKSGDERLTHLNRLLFYHASSHQAQILALETLLETPVVNWPDLSHEKRAFMSHHFATLFNSILQSYPPETFNILIDRFPDNWPLADFTTTVDLDKLYLAITACESQNHLTAALHLLRILKSTASDEKVVSTIDARIQSLTQRADHVRAAS